MGIFLPALYRLAATYWLAIWPTDDADLHYAFVALGVAGLLFAAHLAMLAAYGSEAQQRRIQGHGHILIRVFSAVYAVATGFIWFAVAW